MSKKARRYPWETAAGWYRRTLEGIESYLTMEDENGEILEFKVEIRDCKGIRRVLRDLMWGMRWELFKSWLGF